MYCRSPLFYVGDKRKIVGKIKMLFPKRINRFVEPFVGGGSVFMNVNAKEFILNDIDCHVISLHKMLCSYANKRKAFFENLMFVLERYDLSCSYKKSEISDSLKLQYPKTYFAEFNREGYTRLKEFYNGAEEKNPLILYVLLIYGFNRILRFNSKGYFNVPVGNVDFNNNVYEALEHYFDVVALAKIRWSCKDFGEFISSVKFVSYPFLGPV